MVKVVSDALGTQTGNAKEIADLKVAVVGLKEESAGHKLIIGEQTRQLDALRRSVEWPNSALAQILAGQTAMAGQLAGQLASGGAGGVAAGGDEEAGRKASEALVGVRATATAPVFPVAPPPEPDAAEEVGPVPLLKDKSSSGGGRGNEEATPLGSLSGKTARVYFGECMSERNGGAPPLLPKHGTLSKSVVLWYGGMATPEERTLLLAVPQSQATAANMFEIAGKRRVLLKKLNCLVTARLADCFARAKLTVPKLLKERGELKCSSISEYMKKLLKAKAIVDESPAAFAAFRKTQDDEEATKDKRRREIGGGGGGEGNAGAGAGADPKRAKK